MSRYFHRLAQRTGLMPRATPQPVVSHAMSYADIQERNVETFVDQPAAAHEDSQVVARPLELASGTSLPEQKTTVPIVRQADEKQSPQPMKYGPKNSAPAAHSDRTRATTSPDASTTPDTRVLRSSFEPLSLSAPESPSPSRLAPRSNDSAPDGERASHPVYAGVNQRERKSERNIEAPAPRDLDGRMLDPERPPTGVFQSTGPYPPVKAGKEQVNAETLPGTPAVGSLVRGYGSVPDLAPASALVNPAPRLKVTSRVEVKIGAISLEIHQAAAPPPPAATPLTSQAQPHSAGTAFQPRRYYLRSW